MDAIERTLERLIANWDQLHMSGIVDRAVYDAGMADLTAWAEGRRKLAAVLQAEYQADWREDQDGTYR